MTRKNIGILISGRGSNMKALLSAMVAPDYPARTTVVISNRPEAAGLTYAAAQGLVTHVVDHKAYDGREAFEDALHDVLMQYGVEIVCLAGFMRILTPGFIDRWTDRLINIHPSLLPAFKGLDTHARALETGVKFAGCTVHLVRPAVDDGPILAQAIVPVHGSDTPETLAARVLEAEHACYPLALKLFCNGVLTVEGKRTRLTEPSLTGHVTGADWMIHAG